MSKQSTIVHIADPLDQAVQTVIQDIRIPRNLRAALEVCQRKRAKLSNHGISVVPPRSTGPSTDPRVGYGCQPDNSGSCGNGSIINPVRTALEQGIQIYICYNDESFDWSFEINGQSHNHVTSNVMEALVEGALINIELSLMRAFSRRPQ
jgi:hypothetical protein